MSETETIKLCSGCKFYKASAIGKFGEYDTCVSKAVIPISGSGAYDPSTISFVRGMSAQPDDFTYCDRARREDKCGKAAKFFEPKETEGAS